MNECCGTPAYVAPEVLLKNGYSNEIDIWSLGVIYYTLICHQLPFQSDDRNKTFNQIKNKKPNMYHIAFRSVSKEVQEIVRKMLIKEPNERITSTELLNHPYFIEKCQLGKNK